MGSYSPPPSTGGTFTGGTVPNATTFSSGVTTTDLNMTSGIIQHTVSGGEIDIAGGNGAAADDGGGVFLYAGNAAGAGTGGNVKLIPGTSGGGTPGALYLISASAPGLSAAARPAVDTMTAVVSVASFNQIRTALIAAGLILGN